ncbi:hypothetical protein OG864_09995 [Streptomyces sp. NBC_00124]|uniref:DUF7691 family protein n=1 Tax=Streptomyces sp. NBC_00124 TaxID=2975662 RepID=UPI00225506AC|nr:hypothetical protein [Streptomyces sp. NBC_00124]MCX5359029.1 hypothetical protein [Streptomyces sp. NBC_00124]
MSRNISYNTADQNDIINFLGVGELTKNQQRILGNVRKYAEAHQADLERQGVDWGLTVPEALDHLIAGRADSDAECAGNAYYTALQKIIDRNGSDPYQLGTFSKPSTFFGLMDDELRRLGVPADLLPGDFLFAGPPDGIPFHIPYPMDGTPDIGRLPLARAKPAADAYRAVLDRIDSAFSYELGQLAGQLEFEHDEWRSAQSIDWYSQDTIFFSITG